MYDTYNVMYDINTMVYNFTSYINTRGWALNGICYTHLPGSGVVEVVPEGVVSLPQQTPDGDCLLRHSGTVTLTHAVTKETTIETRVAVLHQLELREKQQSLLYT